MIENYMPKITFCIPSKSNLRYLKTCIPSIRENAYRDDHDIVIFVDSDEDGTVEWLEANKEEYRFSFRVNPNLNKVLYGIGKAYDYCANTATTDVIMIFHADMMLGKHADLHAFKHLEKGTVVCATRIEPPLHPNAGEKILKDFGLWPEEFKKEEFAAYVDTLLGENKDKTTNGIFAPWMIYKEDLFRVGGHDARMHSCREDSDLFNRFVLQGYDLIQSWDSLVYHLTGRGAGSFDGDEQRHAKWKQDMFNSTKEFIRKWGSVVKHSDMMYPIISPKYDIQFRVTNATEQSLEALEIWCSSIVVDIDPTTYIQKEQQVTSDNLESKFKDRKADIVVEIDANKFDQQDYQIIHQLSDIIQQSGSVGKFQLGNLVITINSLLEYQSELICN